MPSAYAGTAKTSEELSLPNDGELRAVASVNPVFQALRDEIVYARRMPAAGMEPISTPVTEDLNGIAAGYIDEGGSLFAPAFVAVGDDDGGDAALLVSRDGAAWVEVANPKAFPLRGVAYDPVLELWAAVGDSDGADAYIITAADPRSTWTERANAQAQDLEAIASDGAGVFVAVGKAVAGDSYILRSTDGITWAEQVSPINYDMLDVIFANGLFVAVGGDGSSARVITSADGITWTERSTVGTKQLRSVAWNGNVFVAVSAAAPAEVTYSPSGTSWSLRASAGVDGASSAARSRIAADLAGPIVVQSSVEQGYMASFDDGQTFEAVASVGRLDAPGSLAHGHMIRWGHGRFIAAAEAGHIIRGPRR